MRTARVDESAGKRREWAQTLRCSKECALRASASAYKVFGALELHCDSDGYCWPTVSTIQKATGIKDRHTIFAALKELEGLGILGRRKLVSRIKGRNAPSLYRIGGKADVLPARAAGQYMLAVKPLPMWATNGRGAGKPHIGRGTGEVQANRTTPSEVKPHTELEVLGTTESVMDSGESHHRFSPNTPDPDEYVPSAPDAIAPISRTLKGKKATAKIILLSKGYDPQMVDVALARVADLADAKKAIPRSPAYFVTSVERALRDAEESTEIEAILARRGEAGVTSDTPLNPMEKHPASKIVMVHEVVEEAARIKRPASEVLAKTLAQHGRANELQGRAAR